LIWLNKLVVARNAQWIGKAARFPIGGYLELRGERIILGPAVGIDEQAGLQLFELDRHVMSFFPQRELDLRGVTNEIF
jgi:hypothetical protein